MEKYNGVFKLNKIIRQDKKKDDLDPKEYCKAKLFDWRYNIFSDGNKSIILVFKILEGKYKGKCLGYEVRSELTKKNHCPTDLYYAITALLKHDIQVGETIDLRKLKSKWCRVYVDLWFGHEYSPYVLETMPL
jgi:hypothetical protein